jgi:hypothetical protein
MAGEFTRHGTGYGLWGKPRSRETRGRTEAAVIREPGTPWEIAELQPDEAREGEAGSGSPRPACAAPASNLRTGVSVALRARRDVACLPRPYRQGPLIALSMRKPALEIGNAARCFRCASELLSSLKDVRSDGRNYLVVELS